MKKKEYKRKKEKEEKNAFNGNYINILNESRIKEVEKYVIVSLISLILKF